MKMEKSGYSEDERRTIFIGGLTGYESTRKEVMEGKREMNWKGNQTIKQRYQKILMANTNWNKKTREKKDTDFYLRL